MPISKTQKAVDLWRSGETHQALKIFRTFKVGISKDERDTLSLAVEMSGDHRKFYEDLGNDLHEVMAEARQIVETKFLKQ